MCHNFDEEPAMTARVVCIDEFSSKYNPLHSLPRPIMLHWVRSWIKQQFPRKIRQQWRYLVSLLIEIKLKGNTQYINENEIRWKLHSIYVCDQGLFRIWKIDTRMNYEGYRSELRNKMHHVICCSSVNDPIIGFKLMPINNLSRKYGMRQIWWKPKGIT